jgi:hypothetical protein
MTLNLFLECDHILRTLHLYYKHIYTSTLKDIFCCKMQGAIFLSKHKSDKIAIVLQLAYLFNINQTKLNKEETEQSNEKKEIEKEKVNWEIEF